MPTLLKTGVLGLVLASPMYLVGSSVAEHNDPYATVSANSTLAHYSPKKHVAGAFKVQSSDSLYPLLTRLSVDFQRFQPKVNIRIKKGNPKAIEEFQQPPLSKMGKIMMVDDRASSFQLLATSHQMSDVEIKEFVVKHGYEPTVVPMAVDAIALYVHKDNPLPGLTLDQIDALFSSTRKRGTQTAITQWGQLGLSDGWRDRTIQLYGRERQSEARAFIKEYGLAGGEFKSEIHEDHGAASVVLDISHNPMGIGYSAIGLHTSSVRTVPIADKDGMPFVLPTQETVADQTYPLRHTLHLYFDKAPTAALPDAVHEFLTFLISREGEDAMLKAGLFPLHPRQAENRAIAFGVPAGRALSVNP
ncbi:MAG TPA: substrate-binding domain-containing protein [Nitrospira sp.]|nr:substrate-binding domain-containing protein [Nitrospira sp.]